MVLYWGNLAGWNSDSEVNIQDRDTTGKIRRLSGEINALCTIAVRKRAADLAA